MRSLLKLGVFAVFAAALVMAGRQFWASLDSKAVGRSFNSPDGRYALVAMNHEGKTLLGEPKQWYEFQLIEQSTGKVIRQDEVDTGPGIPWADLRVDGQVVWGPGPKRVVIYLGKEIIWRNGV